MLAQAKGRLQRFRLVCFLALARVSTFTLRTHNQFALHYYAAIQLHHVPAGVGNWDGQFESIHDSITCNVGKEFGKASLVSTHHCCPTRSMPTRLPVGSIAGHALLDEQLIIRGLDLVLTFGVWGGSLLLFPGYNTPRLKQRPMWKFHESIAAVPL